MKFFLDENLSPLVAKPLAAVYLNHEFGTAQDEDLTKVKDVELFTEIRRRGYEAIITKDRNQHRIEDERRAIFDNGLQWICHRMGKHAGIRGFALESATIVAGLQFVIEELRPEPHLYLVKGIEAQPEQRLKIQRVRLDVWAA
ncbi:hypothetical protein [Paenarthrobacter sp. YJN-5]|uniref:PIN-like domain-containing protein n=1 Tax=Paenarthrobacter sp. YJN-5 TaxID=2735316 RepID=UPI001877C854|nr:hypothetical protein [Paenarthrobacter sp. YJN-5]QOT16513.1 hypothetical protein HMI59_07775 [Paenarthrobacter sp. YJN-5]